MRFSTLTRGAALGGALTLLCASVAQAASGGESTPLNLGSSPTVHAASGGSGSSMLRTIIAMVVVVGLIFAVSKVLRSVKGRDAVRASGNGLEQVASLPLAAGRSVSLVRSGTDIVLLGVAEHGVSVIKTYTEAEARAAGIEIPSDAPAGAADPSEKPMDMVLDRLRRMTVRP